MRRPLFVLAVLVATTALPQAAQARLLDATFGHDGVVDQAGTGPDSADSGRTVIRQGTKLLVGGGTKAGHFLVKRLNADGSLDKTFGPAHNGEVITSFGTGSDFLSALAIDPAGRIVAVGQTIANPTASGLDVAVARYNANGSPDTTLLGTGKGSYQAAGGSGDEFAVGVAFQPAGKIMIGGGAQYGSDTDYMLLRLESDGSLDNGGPFDKNPGDHFGDGGAVVHENVGSNGDDPATMLQQPDGKLLLAGMSDTDPDPNVKNEDISFVRFNADGSLDSGGLADSTPGDHFGDGGTQFVAFDLGGTKTDRVYSLARQPDGRIVAAGSSSNDSIWALARLTSAGQPDTRFSGDGKVTLSRTLDPEGERSRPATAIVQSDGKLMVLGVLPDTTHGQVAGAARLLSNGTLDPSFPGGGVKRSPLFSGRGYEALVGGVAIPGGRVVETGSVADSPQNITDVDLVLASFNEYDLDNDGIADGIDPDVDGDGVRNGRDASPRNPRRWLKPATAGSDRIIGTFKSETICGLLGDDTLSGLAGPDTIYGDACGQTSKRVVAKKTHGGNDKIDGGKGSDRLFGGPGKDMLNGGRGKDTIHAADGTKDMVDCGAGKNDKATVDPEDSVKGCERVTVSQ